VLVLGWWDARAWSLGVVPLSVLLVCNRRLYAFLLRERGPWFLLRVLPLHWLYFLYSGLAFAGSILVSTLVWRRPGRTAGCHGAVQNRGGAVPFG
jgi:hypothetical protein